MTDSPKIDSRKDHEVAREQLAALMAREGLTVEAEFIPFSLSRHAKPGGGFSHDGKPWLSLNWRVDLLKGASDKEPGRKVVETDYSAGSGHTPAAKAKPNASIFMHAHSHETVAREQLIAWECEHGRAGMWWSNGIAPRGTLKQNPMLQPDPVDVFASLAGNADVFNYSGFEDWASSCGYDADSRKAESIYRACLEIALKLRNGLGESVLTEAMELAGQL